MNAMLIAVITRFAHSYRFTEISRHILKPRCWHQYSVTTLARMCPLYTVPLSDG